jgi:hypothetical protein
MFQEPFTLETCPESKDNSRYIWNRDFVLGERPTTSVR